MIYSNTEIQMIHENFPYLLKELNAYGHIDEKEFIVITDGNVYEFRFYGNEVRQIYGDRLTGSLNILSKLFGRYKRHPALLEEMRQVSLEEIEQKFDSIVDALDGNIHSKYSPDYITGLSVTLEQLKGVEGFSELYNTKYKDKVKNNLLRYLEHNKNVYIAIPLLDLLKHVMEYDVSPEYLDILKKYMEWPDMVTTWSDSTNITKYVRIIAKDIYMGLQ